MSFLLEKIMKKNVICLLKLVTDATYFEPPVYQVLCLIFLVFDGMFDLPLFFPFKLFTCISRYLCFER